MTRKLFKPLVAGLAALAMTASVWAAAPRSVEPVSKTGVKKVVTKKVVRNRVKAVKAAGKHHRSAQKRAQARKAGNAAKAHHAKKRG